MNIIYHDNTPFYTSHTYNRLFYLAEYHGKVHMRAYFNTFRDQFITEVQASESLRNIDIKMYISAEIMIALELEKHLNFFKQMYGFNGRFYVSSTAAGIDIIYANSNFQKVRRLEVKCTNGSYKKYTCGNTVRSVNENGYYLSTRCSWKYHLTKKTSQDKSFTSLLDEFIYCDAIHAVLTMKDNWDSLELSELWFINGMEMRDLLRQNRNKQNLIQITPSTFHTKYKNNVELIHREKN